MDNHEINNGRHRFLILATSRTEEVAALGVATPSVISFFPSGEAKVAGTAVEVDASKIEPRQVMTTEQQGKPIWAVNRTAQQLKDPKAPDGTVSDPKSEVEQQPENCRNETRSIKPNVFATIGICTHLGRSPAYRLDVAPADLGSVWKGGFSCPYHGSKFDIARHVYEGVPVPTNLVILPYRCLSDTAVLVGET